MERPLPGYSGAEAAIVQQPALRAPVSWRGKDQISDLGTAFKVKGTFEGRKSQAIRLYAMYIGG